MSSKTGTEGRAPWREQVRPYTEPSTARSWLEIAFSAVPYLALLVAMYLALRVSVLLTLALSPIAAAFLLKTFIVFHDCTHGSLWKSRQANRVTGVLLGLLVYTPFESWAHSHWVHHATAGDLDRRGTGDVPTLTVREYQERSARGRLAYRLFRNPLVMFGLGPLASAVVIPRLVPKDARPRVKRAIIATNIFLGLMVATLCVTIGWWQYLIVQWPAAWMASSAGIFLFYVQHQFEDVYWADSEKWEFAEAALRGSSYLKLPAPLRFITGNIGFHHVHHLSAKIPNYNLPRAHRELDLFQDVPTLTLRTAAKTTRLKLWSEDENRMVGWPREPLAARTQRVQDARA